MIFLQLLFLLCLVFYLHFLLYLYNLLFLLFYKSLLLLVFLRFHKLYYLHFFGFLFHINYIHYFLKTVWVSFLLLMINEIIAVVGVILIVTSVEILTRSSSCLRACSTTPSWPFKTIHIRLRSLTSVEHTTSESILNPRAARIPDTRDSTPGSFCTRQLRTCLCGYLRSSGHEQ